MKDVLWRLKDAGLDSIPGGGAEILVDRVRQILSPKKCTAAEWLNVMDKAHRLGIPTTATMMFGHIETIEDRVEHLCRIREQQDKTGGFQTFIPLAFHPENTGLSHLKKPSALLDLRTIAISRLMLDNILHVKAFWIMQTLHMAQHMLQCGADDIDGTVVWYDITKVSTSTTHQECSVIDLRRAIIDAGFTPVERDTLYRTVIRDGATWKTQ